MSNAEADSASRTTVFVGRQKPVMNYVLAALTVLNNAKTVTLKARGAAISLAVDVAEVTRKRFSTDIKVSNIKLDTEQMPSQDGSSRNVSTIEIELTA
ncbi:MAG: DNA-binding protein Alba [Thaumarchaeota archaeon]|nr:DNA-binding protein Alba [Nitrososphaerota archaeon]